MPWISLIESGFPYQLLIEGDVSDEGSVSLIEWYGRTAILVDRAYKVEEPLFTLRVGDEVTPPPAQLRCTIIKHKVPADPEAAALVELLEVWHDFVPAKIELPDETIYNQSEPFDDGDPEGISLNTYAGQVLTGWTPNEILSTVSVEPYEEEGEDYYYNHNLVYRNPKYRYSVDGPAQSVPLRESFTMLVDVFVDEVSSDPDEVLPFPSCPVITPKLWINIR